MAGCRPESRDAAVELLVDLVDPRDAGRGAVAEDQLLVVHRVREHGSPFLRPTRARTRAHASSDIVSIARPSVLFHMCCASRAGIIIPVQRHNRPLMRSANASTRQQPVNPTAL
eukprot:3254825-Rhodomonas_salina.1